MKRAMPFVLAGLVLYISTAGAQSFLNNEVIKTKIFFTQRDHSGKLSYLKGKIVSFSVNKDLGKDSLVDKVEDKTAVSVRLYNSEAVHPGDTLYVIDEKNLVTAKIAVTGVFKSASFGNMLIGNGNFRLSSLHDRVVQLREDSYSKKGFVYKSRGDYYVNMGEHGKAIVEYKKALFHDKGNPEVHLELGYVYLRQGLPQFALKEFFEGYAKFSRIYDKWDRYRLLNGIVTVRYREVYESYISADLKIKYLDEGIRFCKEALQLYPDSVDMNYFMGVFYYSNPEPSDDKAREHFLKVTELNPDHKKAVNANIILARLYIKHRNSEKARIFASKALESEPYNTAARDLLKILENNEKKGFIK